MKYLSVKDTAKKWGVSERSVRNYCALKRVDGAFLVGKTWNIPAEAEKPTRKPTMIERPNNLLDVLRIEKDNKISGGIYHKIQIDLTYNSNHIEGSKLSHDQTRYIFETNTIGVDGAVKVDDVVETANHFRCIDKVIEEAKHKLSENLIKSLHRLLKSGTTDSRIAWFNVGEYKRLPNQVGGGETCQPKDVKVQMKKLIENYNKIEKPTFDDILNFHYHFECIHPFQDGNGRVGRLIMLKECLKNGYIPFIIDEEHKMFYYRGLKEWENEKGFLRDTCISCQDKMKIVLDYFKIPYCFDNSKE